MADHVINSNQTTTLNVNSNNESWLITKNATFNVNGIYGILESGSGNTISVVGDMNVSGMAAAIRFQGATSKVLIGAELVITATNGASGIEYEGNGGQITVHGVIKGGDTAIHGNLSARVDNHGQISGDHGIIFDDFGSHITNFKSIDVSDTAISSEASETVIVNQIKGQIHAEIGVDLFGDPGENSTVENHGLIDATDIAVRSGNDAMLLTNTGKMIGTVDLGGGNDVFDTSHGTLSGMIIGGDGDDTFYISNSSQKIVEAVGGGDDTVYSTASYVLKGEIDNLVLQGGKDLHGAGTQYDNELTGNKGDNQLIGRNGNDTLNGALGNDTLEGDLGNDVFVFNAGSGKDTVVDFKDGVDLLKSDTVQSLADFEELRFKQVGDDLKIHFGAGDTLILEHFHKADLTYADFDV